MLVICNGKTFIPFNPQIIWFSKPMINSIECHNLGFILMYAARINFNEEFKQRKVDYLNNIGTLLLFVLTIINIFIVAMNWDPYIHSPHVIKDIKKITYKLYDQFK